MFSFGRPSIDNEPMTTVTYLFYSMKKWANAGGGSGCRKMLLALCAWNDDKKQLFEDFRDFETNESVYDSGDAAYEYYNQWEHKILT